MLCCFEIIFQISEIKKNILILLCRQFPALYGFVRFSDFIIFIAYDLLETHV